MICNYLPERAGRRHRLNIEEPVAPRERLLAAAPLVLRCATDRRRCASASQSPAATGRTLLVLCREFESGFEGANRGVGVD